MFLGCSALTEAPKLPAKTLASFCYKSMFSGCKALATAPELPAESLASHCYADMFWGCKALTKAPKLPADLLASSCYQNMFRDCTALTTAPQLLVGELVDYCYAGMFYGCSQLSSVTMGAFNVSAFMCLENWLGEAGKNVQKPQKPTLHLHPMVYEYDYIKFPEDCSAKYHIPEYWDVQP